MQAIGIFEFGQQIIDLARSHGNTTQSRTLKKCHTKQGNQNNCKSSTAGLHYYLGYKGKEMYPVCLSGEVRIKLSQFD
jgi:hypothetical protein